MAATGLAAAESKSLFDGQTLQGWEGDPNWWRAADGCIVGGHLDKIAPANLFLATTRDFTNFIFKTKFRLSGTNGFINSGIQIRSQRVPNNTEMSGYQCDMGDPNWWGSIYDESRRNRLLAQSDTNAIFKVLRRGEWNDYEIRAEGRRIRTFINGVLGVDYQEPDEKIPQHGKLGFQVHGGGATEVRFREITLDELPSPRPSPEAALEQLKSFTVPAGFVVELAASEPELPKPVTVSWDDSGRMWSATLLEYPVDGNEEPGRAESLYKNAGRDRVVVFDPPQPGGAGQTVLGKARVFAEGLAIPTGLLPYKNGVIVSHGPEVVFLSDTDGDGRSDRRETLLSGFGVQDSHLMPHQFTYAPGGWLYLAQGAFNYSKIKTRDGTVVTFDQTKLARFRPDGSEFEILTHGPCNIWGLVITRFGETWIQEANDYGYPTMVFEPGANYPGCGDTKFRPYAPVQPSISSFQMGGTGLSGLAMNEETDGFPGPWRDIMFVANPITRQIQALRIHREVEGFRLEKLPEFMTSTDEWFRPIAIHFGPDGCLYVVDWYNKIISHNEVPRTHPDRDKTRGRVWRVRHESQKIDRIPDIAKAPDGDLMAYLASGNKWQWNAALHQIEQRQAKSLGPALAKMARAGRPGNIPDGAPETAALQIRALWALESLRGLDSILLGELSRNSNAYVRREAVRAAGTRLSLEESLRLVAPLANDPDHYVRAEVIRVAGGQDSPWKHHLVLGAENRPDRPLAQGAVDLLVAMAKPALPDPQKPGAGYAREFERYLIRAALERHPIELGQYLDGDAAKAQPPENLLLALFACPPSRLEPQAASLLTQLKRPLQDEEFAILFQTAKHRATAALLDKMASETESASRLVSALLRLRTRIDATVVALFAERAARTLIKSGPLTDELLRLAGTFKLGGLTGNISEALEKGQMSAPMQISAFRTLRDLRDGPVELIYRFATNLSVPAPLRTEAVNALAANQKPAAGERLFALLPLLSEAQQKSLMEQMSGSPAGAQKLLAAIQTRALIPEDFPLSTLEKMRQVLPGDPAVARLSESLAGKMKRVVRFTGRNEDYIAANLALDGPFTVEAWVRLDPKISNEDGILGGADRSETSLDMNFYDSHFRVWIGRTQRDLVIARRATIPEAWAHYAVTRDEGGTFRIYINGELDNTSSSQATHGFSHLDIGRTIPGTGGTAGAITEYRVWKSARSRTEILDAFDRSFSETELPDGLIVYFPAMGAQPGSSSVYIHPEQLRGRAKIESILDAPPLLSAEQARALGEKFTHYSKLADSPGDAARGKDLFTATCLVCHQAGGAGAGFAPNLDGSALRTQEGLLRALLTPSAALEPGYRLYRVETKSGEVLDGFLAQRDTSGLVLRRPNSEPLKITPEEIRRAGYQTGSIMPEGLLEGMQPRQVSDLFAYLKSLR